jgi:hydroxymethylglutaryl-CoA reductase
MSLHARNIAAMAGAEGDMIDEVAAAMVEEKKVRLDRAKELVAEIGSSKSRDASHKEPHQAKKHPN